MNIKNFFRVACFLPGRANDLSAPRIKRDSRHPLWIRWELRNSRYYY